jgi:hypothetical protein
VATDGLIRPLTLAPSAKPDSPGLGSILAPAGGASPLMGSAGPSPQAGGASGVVGQGNNAPASGAASGAPASAQPGGGANAPVIGYIAPGPAPVDVGTGGGGAPSSGHAVAGGPSGAADPRGGADRQVGRYVATGGGASASMTPRIVAAYSGGGGSLTGTTSSIGTGTSFASGTFPSSQTSAGEGSGGSYSVTEQMPSGGGSQKYEGKIGGTWAGANIIGGGISFDVSGGSLGITNESWSVSGPTPVYASQVIPNPSGSPPGTKFLNTNLDPHNFDNKPQFQFLWGETPGVNTVTLNADVTIDNKPVEIKPMEFKLDVRMPKWDWAIGGQGEVTLYTSPRQLNGQGSYELQYGTNTKGLADAGLAWRFFGNEGSFGVVQVMTSGNYTYTSPAGNFNTLSSAPFDLLDNAPNSTTPFTGNNTGNPTTDSDSPHTPPIPFGATKASMSLYFTDYVMYWGGGMWVPLGIFNWGFDVQCNFGASPPLTFAEFGKPTYSVPQESSSWPSWKGVSWNYLNWTQ